MAFKADKPVLVNARADYAKECRRFVSTLPPWAADWPVRVSGGLSGRRKIEREQMTMQLKIIKFDDGGYSVDETLNNEKSTIHRASTANEAVAFISGYQAGLAATKQLLAGAARWDGRIYHAAEPGSRA